MSFLRCHELRPTGSGKLIGRDRGEWRGVGAGAGRRRSRRRDRLLALEGYSRGAARDLAHRGITVDIIRPGFIDTERNPADGPAASIFLPTTAMGRYGTPEEIAACVVFLAGPQSSCVTNAALRIDGGYGA